MEDVIHPLDYEDDDLYMNVYVRGALGIQYTSATRVEIIIIVHTDNLPFIRYALLLLHSSLRIEPLPLSGDAGAT